MKHLGVLVPALALLAASAAHALPAFPGAEGFGAASVGGRGGTPIKVTNLEDSGPGSLRAAVETAGPRYVVFDVSGIINLQSDLDVYEPFITIAGETSPGGILITGRRVKINTHDVIIRHLRFRVGSHGIAGGADPESLDSLNLWGRYWGPNEAHDIIIDHCSISWGIDENLSITGGVTNATVQWCIVSEALSNAGHPEGEHSKGFLISGKYTYPNTVSVHHNFIAHNADRNPMISTPSDVSTLVDLVNNVSYNWKGGLAPLGVGLVHLNWVHNYARPGPESHAWSFEVTYTATTAPEPILYVHGNLGSTRLSQTDDHWNVGVGYTSELLSTEWRRDIPWDVPPVTTTIMSDAYAEALLLDVGATRPVRDSVDARVVADFMNGTGGFLDDVVYPDDFPSFDAPAPPVDSDGDGMADSWELAELGSLSEPANGDLDGDGYDNLEEYLHHLAGDSPTSPPTDGGVTDGAVVGDAAPSGDGAPPARDGTALPADAGSGGDAVAASSGGSAGCSCRTAVRAAAPPWLALSVLALVVVRRRGA